MQQTKYVSKSPSGDHGYSVCLSARSVPLKRLGIYRSGKCDRSCVTQIRDEHVSAVSFAFAVGISRIGWGCSFDQVGKSAMRPGDCKVWTNEPHDRPPKLMIRCRSLARPVWQWRELVMSRGRCSCFYFTMEELELRKQKCSASLSMSVSDHEATTSFLITVICAHRCPLSCPGCQIRIHGNTCNSRPPQVLRLPSGS